MSLQWYEVNYLKRTKNIYNFQLFAIENVAFVVAILTLVSKSTSESRIFKKSTGIKLIYKFLFIQWDVICKDQKIEFRIMYIQTNCIIFAFFFLEGKSIILAFNHISFHKPIYHLCSDHIKFPTLLY